MGILQSILDALRWIRGSAGSSAGQEGLGPNVVSLSTTTKDRARAVEKQRRAQIEAEREKRWNNPKGK